MESIENNRTKNSINNVIFGMVNKIVVMFLSFFSRSIFLSILSAEYLGLDGLFSDIFKMLSLADLGMGSAMAYSFYKPLALNDVNKIASLTKFYRKIYNYIAIVVAVIGMLMTPFLEYIVNTESNIPNLHVYYWIFLADTVVSYLFVYKSTILSADQKSYLISRYSVWISVAKVIVQIVVLQITHNYICYVLVSLVATFCNNLLISKKVDCLYPYIKVGEELKQEDKKNLFSNIKSVFLYKISSVLLSATDNILISVIVGTMAVGMYANYHTIISNLMAFTTVIFNSLTASVGSLIVREDVAKRYSVFKVMQMISFWLGGFLSVGVYFLSHEFIALWLGEKYLLPNGTLIAIVLNFYLAICLSPIWSFREAAGLYKKTKYIMLITAAINLILSVILGQKFGISGIILASFIAKVLTYFWYEPRLLYRDYFEKKVWAYYKEHMINVAFVIVMILLINVIISGRGSVSWMTFLKKGFFLTAVVNLAYIMRYFRTEEFVDLVQRIKRFMYKEK